MTIEPADPRGADARGLLDEHARDMACRYPDESWAGVDGRKDVLWLARDPQGTAVGCVALRKLGPGQVEVKHLYVTPHARRLGVASALMDALEAEAQRRYARIVLETGTRQPEAIAFYQRRGYLPRGRYEGSDTNEACSVYFCREAPEAR